MNIYYGDHWPPHIHAVYGDYEELLEIRTLAIYEGYLPSKQHKIAVDWLRTKSKDAERIFFEFNPNLNAPRRKNTKNNKNK